MLKLSLQLHTPTPCPNARFLDYLYNKPNVNEATQYNLYDVIQQEHKSSVFTGIADCACEVKLLYMCTLSSVCT